MRDNQLYILIIALLNDGAPAAGLPASLQVMQAYQPTSQGVATGPAFYVHKMGDRLIGSPQRKEIYNAMTGSFDHHEIQQYETTFQISALATQNPSDTAALTASDMINLGAYILKSSATIKTIEAAGIGILRIRTVDNPYFNDDRDRYEAAPSLEFTLTHKQDIVSKTPVVTSTEYQIISV